MKKLILTISIYFAAANVCLAGYVNTDFGQVTNLNLTSDASLTVAIAAPQINPAGCQFSAYFVKKESDGSGNFPEYFTLLLAAKGFGSEVRFRIDDTVCEGPFPKIIFIETRDPS